MPPALTGWLPAFLLLSGLLFGLSGLFYLIGTIGADFSAVQATLRGDAAQFLEPINFAALLELAHAGLFFTMILTVAIGALALRLGLRSLWLHLLGGSGLVLYPALLAAHFGPDGLIWLYLGSFYLWHGTLILLSLRGLWQLARRG